MTYYRRLYPILWTNEKFTALSPAGKLLALHVLTAQANRVGLFAFSLALAGEQTGLAADPWHVSPHVSPHVSGLCRGTCRGSVPDGDEHRPPSLAELFATVVEVMGWRWDAGRRVLYIPSWWKFNLPANPSVLKASLADLSGLPKTALLKDFLANTRHLPPGCVPLLQQLASKNSDTCPPTCGDTWGDTWGDTKAKAKAKATSNTPHSPP